MEHNVTIENVVLNEINSIALLLHLGIDLPELNSEFLLNEIITNYEQKIKDILLPDSEDKTVKDGQQILEFINRFSKFVIKDKAGEFIGTRMGRPEKAKLRKLIGSPNVLFPVGKEGGRMRSFQATLEEGKIWSSFPIYYCGNCNKETIYPRCEEC